MLKNSIAVALGVTVSLFTMSVALACNVTLEVATKQQDIILRHGGSDPATHSLILVPHAAIENTDICADYVSATEFHINNVEQADPAFQRLNVGDIVTGSLNYHRPSPYGKTLFENFHHGFRLIKDRHGDYTNDYKYFRHIGVY